jgi:hypothetical protein
MQPEKILDLRAGDEDGDAIGEADDYGPRDKFHARTQSSDAHDDEQDAGHNGDHEEAVNAVRGDDAGDDDDEGAGGAADLSLGSAKGGDEEAGNNGAVDASLRCQSGAIAKAMASGRATRPTVIPAITSSRNLCLS